LIVTLVLFLHLIELAPSDSIKHGFEISFPSVLSSRQLEALIRHSRSIVSLSTLLIAQHCVRETNLQKLCGRAGFRLLVSFGVFVWMVMASLGIRGDLDSLCEIEHDIIGGWQKVTESKVSLQD
jgi:hypothetical protein